LYARVFFVLYTFTFKKGGKIFDFSPTPPAKAAELRNLGIVLFPLLSGSDRGTARAV